MACIGLIFAHVHFISGDLIASIWVVDLCVCAYGESSVDGPKGRVIVITDTWPACVMPPCSCSVAYLLPSTDSA